MTEEDELETLLKRERRRQGHERLGVMVMVVGLVIGGVGLVAARSSGPGDSPVDAIWMGAAGVSIAAAIATLFVRPGKDARKLESMIGRRDQMQRARNDRVYALSITAWGMVGAGLSPLTRVAMGQGDGHDFFFVATLPLLAFLILMSTGGWDGFGNGWARQNRKWLEDEFTRAMRGRAMALGFPVLMSAMALVYLIGLWKPEWALVAIPVVLIGAASVVGLRFAWLDRQAEASDD